MVLGAVAITSALPSRSTARICCAPQLASHSRLSCQRADSPIFNPVSRTSVIVVTSQHCRGPCHHRHERQPSGSTPAHGEIRRPAATGIALRRSGGSGRVVGPKRTTERNAGRFPASWIRRRDASALVMAHETPGDSRVRALPSPYRARALVSPGVSCRQHDGMRPKGRQRERDLACGQSRARLLTGAGTAVDNPVAGWGRLFEREIPLPGATCSDGREGPVDRKKLRTGCRDLVRYSGRCPHRSHPTRAGHRSRWSAAPGGARP